MRDFEILKEIRVLIKVIKRKNRQWRILGGEKTIFKVEILALINGQASWSIQS